MIESTVRELFQLTNSMEQSPSWGTNSHSASQETMCLKWNPKVITMFMRIHHWSLSWVTQIQSAPFQPISFRSILIVSSHLCLGLPSSLFPLGFSNKNFVYISHLPMHATSLTNLILLDLVTLTVFGEIHKLWSSSLYRLLQHPMTSSLLGPNIIFSIAAKSSN